jgi:hypothetical protein
MIVAAILFAIAALGGVSGWLGGELVNRLGIGSVQTPVWTRLVRCSALGNLKRVRKEFERGIWVMRANLANLRSNLNI